MTARASRSTGKPPADDAEFDTFAACVPWGDWRAVLIHRRRHNRRNYVRLRVWNRHRTKGVWYPSKRSFVIPEGSALLVAAGIQTAATGHAAPKPGWLEDWEAEEAAKPALDIDDIPF